MIKRALLLASAVLFSVGYAAAQPTGPWPMFRGNAAHEGRSAFAGPELPSIRWQHPLLESAYSSPAVGPDGTVYVGSSDALYAITSEGVLRWSASVDDFSISSPAVGANAVYSGSTSGMLYAFSRETGTLLWTFTTGDEIWSSPTIGPDGSVFVGSSDNIVYAVDGTSGEELWRHAMSADVFASPAVSGGVLCAVDRNGEGVLLNTQDGSQRARFSLMEEVVSSPAFGQNGLVIVAGTEGSLHGVDVEDGSLRWRAELGGQLVSSPSVGADGSVYIGSSSGSLFAVDVDGTVDWTTPLGDDVFASPLLDAENRLYVGSVESELKTGTVHAVEAGTGSILWSLPLESPVWSSVSVVEDGTLYLATAGEDGVTGQLLAIEEADVLVGPSEEPIAGSEFDIEIRASPSFNPTVGTLFFRRGGAHDYESADISERPEGDGFRAIVPGSFITERGLEYFVEMSDGEVTRTYPASQPEARPIVQRVRVPNAELPLTLLPRRYHMVSSPLEAEADDPADVLADDYGLYNTTVWRLFRWNGEQYAEFPTLGAGFSPGTAFFLSHRTGLPFTVSGRSVDTSDPIAVTLHPGWNQVAVPFAFPVDWDAVTTADPANADDVHEIAFYDGVEMIQDEAALSPLQPWTGYFIRNASSQDVDLVFPNVESSTASSMQGGIAGHRMSSKAEQSAAYVLQLSAYSLSDNLRDTQNWIGFLPDATDREDMLDVREAPPIGDHVRLSVIESEARFARNYKSVRAEGSVWHLEASASSASSQTLEIHIKADGPIPRGFQTYVVDDDRGRTVALIENRFRVELGHRSSPRRMSVIVGTEAFASAYLEGVEPHPVAFFLDASYPNPFSTTTSIRYGLERAAEVSLEIFDIMGRRVVTLMDGSHEAGRYETTWSGLDSAGRPVANGLYFYRFRAGSFIATRQTVLSR